METLRSHLNIHNWLLFGGSWGVTLALAYAQTHPTRVSALVLRGICLMRRLEVDWAYRGGGAHALAPKGWEAFVKAAAGCTVEEAEGRDLVADMYEKLTSSDAAVRDAAAAAWHRWGFGVRRHHCPPSTS
jgi:proline iminopeptidase